MQKEQSFFCVGVSVIFSLIISLVYSVTDPNDFRVLNEFRNGLENPELLQWPAHDDDPCDPTALWKHIFCKGNRVTQIQVQGLELKGTLPKDFNHLTKLSNLGLQRNKFYGKLPSFSGLSDLEFAYLDFNNFDEIPFDFFDGLSSIRVLALDENPLNATSGWVLPSAVGKLTQMVNFSLGNCNLVGNLPDSLGNLPSLTALKLSYNKLSGILPLSFNQSILQILWLNNQAGEGMSGPIDVISSMPYLTQAWLHGNRFTGPIPDEIGNLASLKDLNLNSNKLVGLIPRALSKMEFDNLNLNNNYLMGSLPKFKSGNVTFDSNLFCESTPGIQCDPKVNALLDFLAGVNFPLSIVPHWSGNDPCRGNWLGISCNYHFEVIVINLPNRNFNGTLSPSVGVLDSLREIRLSGNNLSGKIPSNLTELKYLRLLDVNGNNFEPPLPKFRGYVKLIIEGNPLIVAHNRSISTAIPPMVQSPLATPSLGSSKPGSPKIVPKKGSNPKHGSSSTLDEKTGHVKSKKITLMKTIVVVAFGSLVLFSVLMILLFVLCCKKRNKSKVELPCSVVVHPRDTSDNQENVVKVAISTSLDSHMIDSRNLVISVQVLRKVTDNFAPENELGRGGFGVVYKGEFDDGTKIAVKRMEAGVICSKQVDEFRAEIAVLSKVRHRHLVSLFGYSTECNERLLVYEYMPQGALSQHLFHWKSLNLEPLCWKKRLSIALDVARGMEYLHNLAHQSFIHRDLKSSNILLDDEFRAKVSDFGLVKLAPDREKSVMTRLAGTFGYLAPEYAVTGKVTTKVDVFSFGVVLMELLTGLTALDEDRPENSRYLAEWFWTIKSNPESLISAIDPALDIKDIESINIITDLAGHCTSRDPNHRPDMAHAVSILSPLVGTWKPFDNESEDGYSGINFNLPLKEMLKGWQNEEGNQMSGNSYTSLDDSRGSIPARPTGFADSFTSADAR